MEKVREVVSGTLSMRKTKQIRVRQPLSKLTVVVEEHCRRGRIRRDF